MAGVCSWKRVWRGRVWSVGADLADGEVLPVVEKDLLEVAGGLGIVDDDAGVAVVEDAVGGPVLAADQD